jgi:uncharacterized membrane protein YjjP (DUF1212 family)
VKEFAKYNLMRLLLMIGWVCLVFAIWFLVDDQISSTDAFIGLVIAFIGSGISSWYLLAPLREAVAARIGQRADAAASKYQDMRKAPDEK